MPARTFTNQEGTSNKFWTIEVDGAEHTVHFGRAGTDGQVKTKAFADAAKATASAQKLIAEKLAKGYVEQGTATPPPERPPAAPPSTVASSSPAVAAPPAPIAPPSVVATSAPASGVDLLPHEWAWATWRPLPEAPGEPAPFDRERAAAIMRRAKGTSYGWQWLWRSPPFTGRLTPEEAGAWLSLARSDGGFSAADQASKMAGYSGTLPTEPHLLAVASKLPNDLALAALIDVTSPEEVAEWLLADDAGVPTGHGYYRGEQRTNVVLGVRPHLLPRLEPADRERFVDAVRAKLAGLSWPTDQYDHTYPWQLAAQVGLHAELQAVIDAIADDAYTGDTWTGHHQPQAIAFGLASPDAVQAAFTRLRLRMTEPWHVVGWLAHTETSALELAGDRIARVTNRDEAEAVTRELARVHDPALAPVMLELMRNSKAPALAREWLAGHPLEAAVGLARSLEGRARPQAVEYLRARRRSGDDPSIALPHLGDGAAARLRELVLDPEDRAGRELARDEVPVELLTVAKKKLPAWVDPAALPPVVVGDGRLGLGEVEALLRLLASGAPAPSALEETDVFGWALFEAWLAEGAPAKDKWAMLALGTLGGDATAVRLAPLIRTWPGESQHQRAVLGLGVLGQIGTDTALMLLSGIAEKVKFKGLQQKAREAIDGIAAAKGMSKAELEDRIVPDCGLDERGSRTFDFGPRRFEFVLGPGMKPMVRDESGKVRASPPKPGARDDAALAARAVEEWKLLRKQVGDVAKIQATRLEQAMVTQRRWSVEDFERFVVNHPLQRHLARLLVWRDANTTFRVTDELDYADAEDEPVTLSGEIGIVHPLQLSEPERAAWGEQLADYEIVPPFAQLGRPVLDIEPAEAGAVDLTRFAPARIGASTLVRMLENLGWQRGGPQDGGVYYLHAKPFPSLGVTAVVQYDGVPVGVFMDWEDQSLEHVYVLDVALASAHELGYGFDKRWNRNVGRQLPWGTVDPIVRSEVLADIATILEKAK